MSTGARIATAGAAGMVSAVGLLALKGRSGDAGAWLITVAGSVVCAFGVAALIGGIRGSWRNFVATLGAAALLLGSSLPVYWYTYRGLPEGMHANIPSAQRYAGALAWLVSFVTILALNHVDQRGGKQVAA